MNPFDALDAVAPPPQQAPPIQLQTQQPPYTGSSAQTISPSNSYNPFLTQAQQMPHHQQSAPQQSQSNYSYQHNPFGQYQQPTLEQSFQSMQVSTQQSQQPLFPNRTGGYGPIQPPLAQTNPFQQSFTPPPMPQIPEQYSSFFQPQQQYQSMSSPTSPGNPFLKSSRSQIFSPTTSNNANPFGQQPAQQPFQQSQASNPFMAQQQTPTPTTQTANPWQNQQHNFQQPSYQQLQTAPQPGFQQQQNYAQAAPQQYQQPVYQQTQQSGPQQSANPFDKSSILALYNYPQLAPQRTDQPQPVSSPSAATTPAAPISGHMNPFGNGQNSQQGQPLSAAQTQGVRHVSNESVDFSGLSGRHSPDAFAGLSASFRR
tara:strand:+ start:5025 stop:6134 length:1110 start_codon:yes stop_codon:yes gene_type:complete